VEGDRGVGASNQDIAALQASEIELKYLTHDAREFIQGHGLGRLTIHWQIMIMEHCFNHGLKKVDGFWTAIEKGHGGGASVKAMIGDLGQALAGKEFRKKLHINQKGEDAKNTKQASFNVNGTRNLYILDRSIVIADYSANIALLSKLLNGLPESTLLEWVDTEDRCSMPIAIYRLQEFCSINEESMRETADMMKFTIPKYVAMDERGRKILQKTLADIRGIKKDNEKVEN
jgi:hypothetical protein